MPLSRRGFLKSAGAGFAASALSPLVGRAQSAAPLVLRSGIFNQPVVEAGLTDVWGYNGSVPGPLLRYRKGERVRVEVVNGLEDSTSVHWHGLRVPNAMDGVPNVTQKPIGKGETFLYEFDAIDSGTFWYHPHWRSFEQVARGMYGAFIVEEDKPIVVDREILWVMSDFKLRPDGRQVEDYGSPKDLATVGRLGNVVAINGKEANAGFIEPVRSGERIRMRLINAASARVFSLKFDGPQPDVIAHDGHAVKPHQPPRGAVLLGPGMRVDLVLDCMGKPGDRFAIADAWNKNRPLATLAYSAEKPLRDRPSNAPIVLARNDIPQPDLSRAKRHTIMFQGGLSGQPVFGKVDGKDLRIEEMVSKYGLAWTINLSAAHEAALVHEPFLYLKRGEHVVLTMVNQTGFEHPMHLHGYTFKVLSYNGKPPAVEEWRDTVMMAPRETLDVAFVADNPGDWMFHCHILGHAAAGMMGTVRVS